MVGRKDLVGLAHFYKGAWLATTEAPRSHCNNLINRIALFTQYAQRRYGSKVDLAVCS